MNKQIIKNIEAQLRQIDAKFAEIEIALNRISELLPYEDIPQDGQASPRVTLDGDRTPVIMYRDEALYVEEALEILESNKCITRQDFSLL